MKVSWRQNPVITHVAACAVAITALVLVLGMRATAAPGYGDPLNITTGTVYLVGTAAALQDAVYSANDLNVPATILLSNGTYVISSQLPIRCNNLIIRSLEGNRTNVIVRGPDTGPSATLPHVFDIYSNNVTIADITFGQCLYHGVQMHGEAPYDVTGTRIHNCRIFDCNEQFIKGSSANEDPVGSASGVVENCLFEFTGGWAYQYYTGGIDIHKGVDWQIRDNLFRNIRNPGGGMAEHAIHFWKRCDTYVQNVVVERNWIINCDRGIGFGLGAVADGFNGGSSVIRNNFVYNDGSGPNTDVGIGLESADSVSVDNNTIFVPYWAPIEYRWTATSNVLIRNNLVNSSIASRDGGTATKSNNIENAQPSWFLDLPAGDLHVIYGTGNVIDQGITIADFADDLDGQARPKQEGWDIGADEYDPATADSDGDGMSDGWEVEGGLNPLSSVGDDGPGGNPDSDAMSNAWEFAADTRPDDAASVLAITGVVVEAGNVRLCWQGGTSVVQMLEYSSVLLPDPTWEPVFTNNPPTSTSADYLDVGSGNGPAFYRIRASR